MYFETRFYFDFFFFSWNFKCIVLWPSVLCSFSPFLLNLWHQRTGKCWEMFPLRPLSAKKRGKNASIVHLWADDSLAFGLASFCSHLSTQAEYEWKIPKYTLKRHDNFLESFGTQHNELFTANGNSVIRRKLLEVLVCLWSVGRGQGKDLC